jgi:hypothetical protein
VTDKVAARAKAIADLIALVKAAPNTLLEEISVFDSQMACGDEVKHLAALKELWTTYDCSLYRQPDNSWYPLEPIELASYAVDGQSDLLSAYCNALLLIADLEDGQHDYMDYRWNHTPGAAWFEGLPERFRAPLLEGLRHAEGWDGEPLYSQKG